MSQPPAQLISPEEPRRALALDCLRGLAIFGMCLSGIVHWDGLPNWMYHAQFPRDVDQIAFDPTHAGFTWVDLVFPGFLFAMGVAFPFALSNRLKRGFSIWQAIWAIFKRGAAIAAFAFYVQHISPWSISREEGGAIHGIYTALGMDMPTDGPGNVVMLISLLGFALVFAVYTRFPRTWSVGLKSWIRGSGIAAMALYLLALNWHAAVPSGAETHPALAGQIHNAARAVIAKFDIIIMVLANVAVTGSLVWLFTRRNLLLRLGMIAVFFAAIEASWEKESWIWYISQTPAFWVERSELLTSIVESSRIIQFFLVELPAVVVHLGYNKYLAIVIPGTIVGDLLLKWMEGSDAADAGRNKWDSGMLWGMALFLLALVVFVHIGLQARWTIITPFAVIGALTLATIYIFRDPGTSSEELLASLFRWAFFWMVLGLLFESTEGGIKKDPANRSYYFVSLSLNILLLIKFIILIDILKHRRPFYLLIASGQNPMIAYAGIRGLLGPLSHLKFIPWWGGEWLSLNYLVQVKWLGADSWLYQKVWQSAWWTFPWSFAKAAWLAWAASFFTKRKIVWRT